MANWKQKRRRLINRAVVNAGAGGTGPGARLVRAIQQRSEREEGGVLSRLEELGARQGMMLRPRSSASRGYRGTGVDSWLKNVIDMMVSSRQVAVAATPGTEIEVQNASAVYHGYKSVHEFRSACLAAVQGAADKETRSGALSAAVTCVNNGTAAAGFDVFGWRLRLTASQNNYAFRPFIVDVGPVLNTAGVFTVPSPIITFAVYSQRLPCDLFVVSPANAGGLATIRPGTHNQTTATTQTTTQNGILVRTLADANTFAVISSLNARDLVSRAGAWGCADEEDSEEDFLGGTEVYPGIRDEDEGDF
jgi:hypothetical protein